MIHQNYYRIQKWLLTALCISLGFIYTRANSQVNFADKCIGKWEGIMYVYAKGKIRDSVSVQLIVQKTSIPDMWIWKTNYLSKSNPMEKNYKLLLKDTAAQTYLTDEGDGVELWNYYFNNKLFSVFETHDVMLTSSYELQGNHLIFEVTSGRKMEDKNGVTNYSVLNLQRVVFKKAE